MSGQVCSYSSGRNCPNPSQGEVFTSEIFIMHIGPKLHLFSEGSLKRCSPRTGGFQKTWHLGEDASHLRKRGILGVLFSKMPRFPKYDVSWKTVLPRCHIFQSVMYLGKQDSQDATFSVFQRVIYLGK